MFEIPTVDQFNKMPIQAKRKYLDYECARCIEPNVGGYLIYPEKGVFIEYKRDSRALVNEAKATPWKEAQQWLLMRIVADEGN